jgi:hypothetical protein
VTIERNSAASFCQQVAALVLDMFCNFHLLKNCKIANNSATPEAREKISPYLESFEFYLKNLMYIWLKLKTIKICHKFLVTTKLLSG